jgi:hypothetical protein
VVTAPIVPVLVDVDGVINVQPDTEADLAHWPSESWRRVHVRLPAAGVSGMLTYSTCVIDGLRRIDALPHTQMMWCTTWFEDAITTLAPEVGLGNNWPVMTSEIADGQWWREWWKAVRASEQKHRYGQLVWIDDDITTWGVIARLAADDGSADWLRDNALTICPDTARGLTAQHLEAIETYL